MSLSDNRSALDREGKCKPGNLFPVIVFLAAAAMQFAFTAIPAFAEDEPDPEAVHVASIVPVFVERGETTYMVTLRALVTNNGSTENISIDVAGKDDQGYVLQNVRFTGTIAPGRSRMLMEQFQIRGETYDRISTWEVRR